MLGFWKRGRQRMSEGMDRLPPICLRCRFLMLMLVDNRLGLTVEEILPLTALPASLGIMTPMEDVMTTRLILGTFMDDSRIPTVPPIAGWIVFASKSLV